MFFKKLKHLQERIDVLQKDIARLDKAIEGIRGPEDNKGLQKVINGKLYSVDDSEFVLSEYVDYEEVPWAFKRSCLICGGTVFRRSLYKGKTDWFLECRGEIKVIGEYDAKKYLEDNPILYQKYFGEIELA